MKSILITCTLLFSVFWGHAQQDWCGSDASLLTEGERRAALASYQGNSAFNYNSRNIDSVAVTVHIVNAAGNIITFQDVEEQIAKMNRAYRSAGIEFFLCGSIRVVRGLEQYNRAEGDELNSKNRVANTINIYIAEDIEASGEFTVLGYATFPYNDGPVGTQVESRYIMMNQIAWNDGSTLIHEMGHFYGLWHTHTRLFGAEFVDGSNCTSAGDLLCDTPADPNLLSPNAMAGCNYVGNYVDSKGDFYSPSVANYMSYAPIGCQSLFSDEQLARIRAVNENENAYLISNCDFYPDFGVEPEFTSTTIRSDEDITIKYAFEAAGITKSYDALFKIILRDPDGSGLGLYEENIRIEEGQNTFSRTLDLDFPITKGTGEYVLEATIDAEFEIIERTENNNFALTTIEVDNSSLDDILVFPNPAVDELKLFFRERRASGAFKMRVFAYDGRFILEQGGFKNREEYFQVIDVSKMNKGLYILKVDFEKSNREYVFKFLKL